MTLPIATSEPVRLKRGRRRLVYGVGLGLWLSGAVWLLFHYFLRTEAEFGPVENPLTRWWLAAHGFFAFATLWLFGLLWGDHVVGAWKSRRHRISGGILFALLAFLAGSGYLLYYAGGDETRALVSILHWTVGLALPLPFVLHRSMKALRKRSAGKHAGRHKAKNLESDRLVL